MKKSISILLAAILILSIFTACSGKPKDAERPVDPSNTEDVINTSENSEAQTDETVTKNKQGKYVLEEAEKHENQYITEKYSYEGVFTPYNEVSVPKEKYILRLPQLKLDSESAKQINKRICDRFEDRVKLSIQEYENECDFWDKISWESYLYNDILSLIITQSDYMSPMQFYYNYSINVVTGEEVEHEGILNALGLSEKEFTQKAKVSAQKKFEEQASYYKNYEERYRSDLEKTVSDDNINSSVPVFIDDNGVLKAIVSIHISGGADYHDEIIKVK